MSSHLIAHRLRPDWSTDRPTAHREVLEAPGSVKIFFDARRDSDALYHQFGVKLQCVLDCQVRATKPPALSHSFVISRDTYQNFWFRLNSYFSVRFDSLINSEFKFFD